MTANGIQSILVSLEVSSPDSIHEFYPRVRDRDDVRVMRCDKSGVIFLSRSDHATPEHYAAQTDLAYWSAKNRKQALLECYEDDARRAGQFGELIRGRRWLDIGTGVGGILDLLANQASETCAVEPQPGPRQELVQCGYHAYAQIEEVESDHFDVVTLFHVFEHLPEPLDALRTIAGKLAAGGRVILEVPHANDFLLSFLNLEAFKQFTFWSEHLILHTRASLEKFLSAAGFNHIEVRGYQRYPLANHLYWLARGKPGGHKEWSMLLNEQLDQAYSEKLNQLDRTDTLIAIAGK